METTPSSRITGNGPNAHPRPSGPGSRRDRCTASRTESDRGSALTPRETEILRYLARGLTVREVARELHLSPKTVDSHKTCMMR